MWRWLFTFVVSRSGGQGFFTFFDLSLPLERVPEVVGTPRGRWVPVVGGFFFGVEELEDLDLEACSPLIPRPMGPEPLPLGKKTRPRLWGN